jgi:hypothetical protein
VRGRGHILRDPLEAPSKAEAKEWTPRRKAKVIKAVTEGKIALEEALRRHKLTGIARFWVPRPISAVSLAMSGDDAHTLPDAEKPALESSEAHSFGPLPLRDNPVYCVEWSRATADAPARVKTHPDTAST